MKADLGVQFDLQQLVKVMAPSADSPHVDSAQFVHAFLDAVEADLMTVWNALLSPMVTPSPRVARIGESIGALADRVQYARDVFEMLRQEEAEAAETAPALSTLATDPVVPLPPTRAAEPTP